MGGLNVKILISHLGQQVADVMNDGVQTSHHLRRRVGQLRSLILPDGLRDRRLQVSFYQPLHSLTAGSHRVADVAGQFYRHHNGS